MAQNEFTIQIDIQKPIEEVWETLIDFDSYKEWNSVLEMQNNDSLEVGKKFKVTIINENGKKSKFKAKLLTRQENSSFSARQIMIGKWFFSATHHFILEKKSETETTLTQSWNFSGILFKPLKKTIFKQLERFNQMNTEIKAYLENKEWK